MRLTCSLEIGNRILPSLNVAGKRTSARTQISIGRNPGSDSKDGTLFLMICTAQNRVGTKYKLKANIDQVFTKFVNEGKMTIRVKEPPHDLIISKADVIQLKGFLQAMKLGLQNKDIGVMKMSTLRPVSTAQMEAPKTRMAITSRKDYPVTSSFPASLQRLTITGCGLRRVDGRIEGLRHLRVLDLSRNQIWKLPEALGRLCHLVELHLYDNCLESLPASVCTDLSSSLVLLDLGQNPLKELPAQFCQLTSLVTLKLNNNQLTALPKHIASLSRLRYLSAACNQLTSVPCGLLRLRLESVDLYGNPFVPATPTVVAAAKVTGEAPTLLECAARTVKKYRMSYTEEDIPASLVAYLDSAEQCLCGRACFEASIKRSMAVDLRTIAVMAVSLSNNGNMRLPVDAIFCSHDCLRNFSGSVPGTIAYFR
ncbi:PREDICTED: leucine-rich repeat protein 1-like [Priapulus caudatus]|uniref:Leucine-rich repeat protein 1-like n=1 Tax=Priapulus caudatus TaxID=37621 RepID=A0ABM1EX16_PRICU|nr:PREDICTED: leucine-rich repeat protein 1-like [Priapulus caudatus]XP_014676744.1 PREDICTED: leucine-rich repeat protein 1-like [Priapulus caudatus]